MARVCRFCGVEMRPLGAVGGSDYECACGATYSPEEKEWSSPDWNEGFRNGYEDGIEERVEKSREQLRAEVLVETARRMYAAGFKQGAIAIALGKSQPTISRMISERSGPSPIEQPFRDAGHRG